MHPALRRDKVLVVSIEEMEQEIMEHIPLLREEGFSEKMFTEIGILARNRVEDGNLFAVGINYSPQDAILELLDDALVNDHLLTHLGDLERARVLQAALQTSMRAYAHVDTLLRRMGFADMTIEEFDIFLDDWLTDTDFLLCINYH